MKGPLSWQLVLCYPTSLIDYWCLWQWYNPGVESISFFSIMLHWLYSSKAWTQPGLGDSAQIILIQYFSGHWHTRWKMHIHDLTQKQERPWDLVSLMVMQLRRSLPSSPSDGSATNPAAKVLVLTVRLCHHQRQLQLLPTAEMGIVIFVSVSTTPPRWIFSLFLVPFFLWAIVLLDSRHFTIPLNT